MVRRVLVAHPPEKGTTVPARVRGYPKGLVAAGPSVEGAVGALAKLVHDLLPSPLAFGRGAQDAEVVGELVAADGGEGAAPGLLAFDPASAQMLDLAFGVAEGAPCLSLSSVLLSASAGGTSFAVGACFSKESLLASESFSSAGCLGVERSGFVLSS